MYLVEKILTIFNAPKNFPCLWRQSSQQLINGPVNCAPFPDPPPPPPVLGALWTTPRVESPTAGTTPGVVCTRCRLCQEEERGGGGDAVKAECVSWLEGIDLGFQESFICIARPKRGASMSGFEITSRVPILCQSHAVQSVTPFCTTHLNQFCTECENKCETPKGGGGM